MLKPLNKYIFFFFVNVILFCACNKIESVTPAEEDKTNQYILRPLGDTLLYEINEAIKGTSSETNDTFLLQEVVYNQVISTDKVINTLHRFSKDRGVLSYPIQPQSVWKSELSSFRYVKVEDSRRYVRLEFPLSQSKQLDGNDENIESQEQYEVLWIDQPYVLNDSVSFDETLYISQKKITALTTVIEFYEVYAKNVGLIEKYENEIVIDVATSLITSSSLFHQKLMTNATD